MREQERPLSADEKHADYIARSVAAAPPLTEEQKDKIRAIFNSAPTKGRDAPRG